jgi:hypothetical protein
MAIIARWTHAAGELEGVLIEAPVRGRDADAVEHVDGMGLRLRLRHVGVDHELLDHLLADGQRRREGGHRLLEDHRDRAALTGAMSRGRLRARTSISFPSTVSLMELFGP